MGRHNVCILPAEDFVHELFPDLMGLLRCDLTRREGLDQVPADGVAARPGLVQKELELDGRRLWDTVLRRNK